MFGCSMVKYIFVSQIILTSQKTVHVLHVTLIQNLHNICQLNCNVQHCRNKKIIQIQYHLYKRHDTTQQRHSNQGPTYVHIYVPVQSNFLFFIYARAVET